MNTNEINKTILFLEKVAKNENIKYKVFEHDLSQLSQRENKDWDSKYIIEWLVHTMPFFGESVPTCVKGIKYDSEESEFDAYDPHGSFSSLYFLAYKCGSKWCSPGRVSLIQSFKYANNHINYNSS